GTDDSCSVSVLITPVNRVNDHSGSKEERGYSNLDRRNPRSRFLYQVDRKIRFTIFRLIVKP
ncbi:unnamed protein product, partial [Arabidopsis halleri]